MFPLPPSSLSLTTTIITSIIWSLVCREERIAAAATLISVVGRVTMPRWSHGWGVSFFLLALLLQQQGILVAAQKAKPSLWQTLSGNAPEVIAKGGFSGLFPDSSNLAYNFALLASSPATIFWCDVRLTKDGVGVCLADLKLENCTDIAGIYPTGKKSYDVNGVSTPGWFSVDYDMAELGQVSLIQGIYSRTSRFDSSFPILAVEDVVNQFKPPGLWLNIQNDIFYTQHNLSMRSYLLSVTKRVIVNYISSPELGFLSGIAPRFAKSKTRLIFRFLGENIIEPSTNQSYGSLSKNLTFIKTFASGVLVPKHYIWPTTSDNYLMPYTSIVMDAHKEGLEIYAGDFANDAVISYNYSYDPVAEYLSFVDNGIFSVDGVLSDFPITPSESIGCFSHVGKNSTDHEKPIIISHNGASGIYPDCTDLAYQQAVQDGADFIDCPVQVTKDGILVCMSSINLMDDTTVTKSSFGSLITTIPAIQSTPGIFTFNLTWDDIQKNLKPLISNPEINYKLVRNPLNKNSGGFMKLSDFLTFAKDKDLSGVLIGIENAAFLAERLGFSVIDAVITTLNDTGYNNLTTKEVMIQSTNSSVLVKLKQQTKYKLLYVIDESIRDAVASSITDIKKFADAVAIDKQSIFPESLQFITSQLNLVEKLQNNSLSVYVYGLRNEFVSQPWDFFSDPLVEINSHIQGAGVDGIITAYPGTVRAYKRNTCSKLGNDAPAYMLPVQPGGLLQLVSPQAQPPALSPMPVLDVSDVSEPPLPAAALTPPGAPPSPQPSSMTRCTPASIFVSLAVLGVSLLI